MKWVREPKIEHNLKRLGIKFDVQTIKLSEIDRQLSADKQVRLGKKINDEWVLQYAEAGQEGSAFPMPILNKIGKIKYFIWSGNHRTAAAELLGDQELDAYVVEVNDQRISDILPRIVNAWEAQGVMAKDEKLVHAKYLVDHHSMEPKDAAKLLAVKWEWLNAYLRSQKAAEKMNQEGVSPDNFPKSILLKLATIMDNSNVLRETASLINKQKLAGREAEQFIDDVKRHGTELQRLREVARWEDMIKLRSAKPKVRVPHKQNVRDLFLSLMQRIEKLTHGLDTREKLQLVDDADFSLAKKLYNNFRKVAGQILEN